MTTWLETYVAAFTEADAAKEAAKAAFLATHPTPLNPTDVPLLADTMTTANLQALLKHIGPVSSDGTVQIGVKYTTDPIPVPQLDLATTPGLVRHTPFTEVTITSGYIECLGGNEWLVHGSGLFQGIVADESQWQAGDIIGLTFLDSPHIVHAAAGLLAPIAPLHLTTKDGVGQDIRYDSVHGEAARKNGRIRVQLRTDGGITPSPCWQLIGVPIA